MRIPKRLKWHASLGGGKPAVAVAEGLEVATVEFSASPIEGHVSLRKSPIRAPIPAKCGAVLKRRNNCATSVLASPVGLTSLMTKKMGRELGQKITSAFHHHRWILGHGVGRP